MNEPVDYDNSEPWQGGIEAVREATVPDFDADALIQDISSKPRQSVWRGRALRLGVGSLAASMLLILSLSALRPTDTEQSVLQQKFLLKSAPKEASVISRSE